LGTGPCAAAPDCTAGFYCPEGAKYQIPCPSGTFSLAGKAFCTTTSAGKYSPWQSAIEIICGGGFYCPAGAYGADHEQCPLDTYVTAGINPSIASCLPCPTGKYCLPGTEVPADCPVGYYCD